MLAICNVRDATIARESHDALYTHAGPEIGVASTKAFTTQLVALYLLALKLGHRARPSRASRRGARRARRSCCGCRACSRSAAALDEARARDRAALHPRAATSSSSAAASWYPIALEGALKLKEISYIHAEGYAAGEMKHGPIALIDEQMPVVVIATRSPVYDKMLSNLEEVRARDGKVIAIATEGDEDDRREGQRGDLRPRPRRAPHRASS